jgi:hypothetical protein
MLPTAHATFSNQCCIKGTAAICFGSSPIATSTFVNENRNFAVENEMSALGQKRACAPQNSMSALPLIATTKADIRNGKS